MISIAFVVLLLCWLEMDVYGYQPHSKSHTPRQNQWDKRTSKKDVFVTAHRRIKRASTQRAPKLIASSESSQCSMNDVALCSEERLQKVIARAGIASRRDSESLISSGKVAVNGRVETELGRKVNFRKDKISVQGRLVSLPDVKNIHWVVINKPKGVLTTLADEKNRETILSLIPQANDLRLVPVGRMDRDHTGLLLLTNEVGWIHPLTHPSFQILRQFEIVVQGYPSEGAMNDVNLGTAISTTMQKIPPCSISIKEFDRARGSTTLLFQSDHYSSSLVDEVMQYLQCSIISSKRTGLGPLRLNNLKKGEWKELLPAEINKLKTSCTKSAVLLK